MSKLIKIALMCLLSSTIFPITPDERAALIKETNAYLKAQGIEILDGEVKIVPASQYMLSTKTLKADPFVQKEIKKYFTMHDEYLKNGFVYTTDPVVADLKNLHQRAAHDFKKNLAYNPKSSGLSKSLTELRMAYVFLPVSSAKEISTIGFAPMGGYHHLKDGELSDGWDGAVQFFDRSDLGTCSYSEHNMKLAHGGIKLIKELVTYEVNGKPTVMLVQGNAAMGFSYKLSWYDNVFDRKIECFNQKYDESIKEKMFVLAQSTDRQ